MPEASHPEFNDPGFNQSGFNHLESSAGLTLLLPNGETRRAFEAIVLSATDPVPSQLLAELLEISVQAVLELAAELQAEYDSTSRGFQLAEVAGGWRYQTHPDLSTYLERFALEGQTARLSTAALETLAIVAYKQPISRAQVSAIRGVSVDGVLRTLESRGYVAEVGQDSGPGQAVFFGTTTDFLDKLGLASLDALPALGDFVPSAEVLEILEQTLRVDKPETESEPKSDVEPKPVESPEVVESPEDSQTPPDLDTVIDLREQN